MIDRVVCVLQARLSSSRLPAKALLQIEGKSLLRHCFDKAVQSGFTINNIFLLTSADPADDLIANEFASFSSPCNIFRGDLDNLTLRYLAFCFEKNVNRIVRITCDNPLTSPSCLEALRLYLEDSGHLLGPGHYTYDPVSYSYGEIPDALLFPSSESFDFASANSLSHPIDYISKMCKGSTHVLHFLIPSMWIEREKFISIDTYDDFVRVSRLMAGI